MTAPTYQRSAVPSWLITVLIVCALLIGVGIAWASMLDHVRADERARIQRTAQALQDSVATAERHAAVVRVDSMRAVLAAHDSTAAASATAARQAIVALRARLAMPTAARVPDTAATGPIAPAVALPATPDTSLGALASHAADACTAALNDCDIFKIKAKAVIDGMAATLAADSTHMARQAVFTALLADSLTRVGRAAAARPSWRALGEASGAAFLAGAVLCLVFCK